MPVTNLLGEEGGGWRVAMSTAGFERGRYRNLAGGIVALHDGMRF